MKTNFSIKPKLIQKSTIFNTNVIILCYAENTNEKQGDYIYEEELQRKFYPQGISAEEKI